MKQELIALLLVVLLAFGLRITGITYDALWLDESYQSLVESYSQKIPDLKNLNGDFTLIKFNQPANPIDLLKHFRQFDPLCPPLYALSLNSWIHIFGGSDLSVRLMSLFFSMLTILVSFFLVKSLFSYPIALFTALLIAISPFEISYAQEARMYTLTLFLSLIAGLSQLKLIDLAFDNYSSISKKKVILFIAMYVISISALINTHYTNLIFLFTQVVIVLYLTLKTKNTKLLKMFSICGTLILLLFLPTLGLFISALKSPAGVFYVSRQPSLFWPFYAFFIRIPLNLILFLSGKKIIIPCLALYVTSILIYYFGFAHNKEISKIKFNFLIAWLAVPSIILWILDIIKNQKLIVISRYIYYIAPASFIVAAIGLWYLYKNRPQLFKLIFAIQVVFALININYTHLVLQREPWRNLAQDLSKYDSNKYFVFVCQYYDIICLDRYLKRPYRQIGLDTTYDNNKIQTIFNKLKPQNFILITAQEGHSIVDKIPSNYKLVKDNKYFHGLHLLVYINNIK